MQRRLDTAIHCGLFSYMHHRDPRRSLVMDSHSWTVRNAAYHH